MNLEAENLSPGGPQGGLYELRLASRAARGCKAASNDQQKEHWQEQCQGHDPDLLERQAAAST